MKKALLFFCLYLAANTTKSQINIYHPFADSNAIWRVDWAEAYCYNNNHPQAHYQYEIQGDTIIGSFIYHKIVRVMGFGGFVCGPYYRPGAGYKGAIRQDTSLHQVFFVPGDTIQEEVLYDFTLNVGDTVKGKFVGGTVVQSIDSILIGTSYRKKFTVYTPSSFATNELVEGVGCLSGLLEPPRQLDLTTLLLCYLENGNPLYSTGPCDLPNSVDDYNQNNQTIIYPNPTSGTLTLQSTNQQFSNSTITIFNSLGEIVFKSEIHPRVLGAQSEIDISSQPAGIYFLKVADKNRVMLKKIVKM